MSNLETETIEQLEYKLEHKHFQVDSLKHEIDTLQWENQIWDFNVDNRTTRKDPPSSQAVEQVSREVKAYQEKKEIKDR